MRFLLAAAVALMLAGAAAAASGVREATAFEPAASWAAGKPVRVYCDPSVSGGWTDRATGTVSLAPDVCADLRARLAGRGDAARVADALRILAHEAQHARGIHDESQAECAALRYLPGMASRFFGYRTWRSRHDLMAVAWESHQLLPDGYRRDC